MTIHERSHDRSHGVKCPRCQVSLGRQDTMCWACQHVVKPPGAYIKYVWIWISLKVAAAAVAVLLLVKYKTEVEGVLHAALRSILQSH